MSEMGHNSGQGVEAGQLRAFIERIERMDEEIFDRRADRKAIFDEAKAAGYSTGTIRKIVALGKRKPDDVSEEFALLEMYAKALGIDLGVFG